MTDDVYARARRTTRRWVLLALAGLVAAVLAGSAIVAIVRPSSPPLAVGAPAPSPAHAPVTATDSPPAASVLPADVSMTEMFAVSLPRSPSAGPADVSGGLARGFRHDPAGAVLAAVHLSVRTSPQVGSRVFDPTLRTQVVGPDAAAMRSHVAEDYDVLRGRAQVPYGRPAGRLYATLAGYLIDAYSDTDARLRLLTVATDANGVTAHIATSVHVRWTGGDWVLVAPPGGTWDAVVSVITAGEAARFTPVRAAGHV